MKGVQCYELFGGIALKIHTFSFSLYREHDLTINFDCHMRGSTEHYLIIQGT